jgi:hypothetical protein
VRYQAALRPDIKGFNMNQLTFQREFIFNPNTLNRSIVGQFRLLGLNQSRAIAAAMWRSTLT